MSPLRITIASPPDRAHLVAEVFLGDEQLAELSHESLDGAVALELYPRSDGQPWRIEVEALLRALADAKARLTSRCHAVAQPPVQPGPP